MATDVELNLNELFHLAILDSRNGRHDQAIVKLKRCIALSPTFSGAQHMLAAEHAEIGMFKEAIDELDLAIQLDPNSVAARFQLGLLHMMGNDPVQARGAWEPLQRLDPKGPWNEFRTALESLMNQDTVIALRHLNLGLAMEFPNAALRSDMSKLRDRIKDAMIDASDQVEPRAGEMLLKTYRGGSGESDG